MTSASEAAVRLAEIDALQDDVLAQLAELERRCEEVLASCQTLSPAKATIALPKNDARQAKPAKRRAA